MRWLGWLGWLGAPLPALVLAACTAEPPAPDPDPGPPVRATPASLAAIAEEHLGVEPTEVEAERIVDPSCPATYRHVLAAASFDGARVGITLRVGHCHRDRYTCTPREEPRRVGLTRCTEQDLGDGRVLTVGRQEVYQAPTSRVAQVEGDGYVVTVGADEVEGWDVEVLADLASDPAYAPLVDPAYVARGRQLAR